MKITINKQVADAVANFDKLARALFEERAAIIEYMGKIPGEEADVLALAETQNYIATRIQRQE